MPSAVAIFLVITFAASWAIWALAHPEVQRLTGVQLPPGLLVLVGTAVPSTVAFLISIAEGSAGQLVSSLTHWRVHPGWYVLALLGPPAVMVIAIAGHLALGGVAPAYPAAHLWPLVAVNFLAVLLIGGPLGEEIGWRGYALPRLSVTAGPTYAAVLLGILWAVWHVPLSFLVGTPQAGLPMVWFAVQAVSFSIILAILYRETGGSLVLPILLHTSANTFAGPLRVLPPEAGSSRPFILMVLLTTLAALVAVAAFGDRS